MSNNKPICARCKKEIESIAYVRVQPTLILQPYMPQTPPLFKCREHAENFAKPMDFHDDCWIDELLDHEIPIHDMKEIEKKYLKAGGK